MGMILMVLEVILMFLGVVLVVLEATGPQVALAQVWAVYKQFPVKT